MRYLVCFVIVGIGVGFCKPIYGDNYFVPFMVGITIGSVMITIYDKLRP